MKLPSPAFLIASLTALVTTALIVLLFSVTERPELSGNPQTVSAAKPITNAAGAVAKPSLSRARSGLAVMTYQGMDEVIKRLDQGAENPRPGFWRFTIEKASVISVADQENDRVRILVGIKSAKELTSDELRKISQSNFDSALDARYAISQDILWSIYVHPLKALSARQLISAIGQTVNLAKSYSSAQSSGGILFEGGDQEDFLRFEMIENLIKLGTATTSR